MSLTITQDAEILFGTLAGILAAELYFELARLYAERKLRQEQAESREMLHTMLRKER
jgi:hypothetical protein